MILSRPLRTALRVALLLTVFAGSTASAQESPAKDALSGPDDPASGFRTDVNRDESLPWYQVREDAFPPEGSAHYFSGELIGLDPIERTGTLRVDRTDAQSRSHFDLPVSFRLLPYGSVAYHGAPAELRDVPIGTHLHGWFYLKKPEEEIPTIFFNRRSVEAEFTQAFRLEDDFSYYASRGRAWRIESVDLETMKLVAMNEDVASGEADEETTAFDLLDSTRVQQGRCAVQLSDLAAGQVVQLNVAWATLYGPGRVTDIWIDEESREVATARQLAVHRRHQRDRGLAGLIEAVDNANRKLTVTLFGGVDPALLDEFRPGDSVATIVAEPSLRSYDQVNDRKGGRLLDSTDVESLPGSSGRQLTIQVDQLLEGFRPGRIVRLFPGGWPVVSLPLEEALFPERD